MRKIRVFNHTLHKALWNWIADNDSEVVRADKNEWPGWKDMPKKVLFNPVRTHYCFCCMASISDTDERLCLQCPLEWDYMSGLAMTCYDLDKPGLFSLWEEIDNEDYKDFGFKSPNAVARKIANLKINPRKFLNTELIII